jgi:subfamily B ATP-binding cassette protein MsbA
MAFFMFLTQLFSAVGTIASFNTSLQSSLASVERIFEILDTEPDVQVRDDGGVRHSVLGALSFEGVTFSYKEDQPVLRDISFSVEPKTRVALVGHSGAGKTTLATLVPRFYDPDQGRVLVDGIDLRELDLRHYRQQVGFVPQDIFLFDRTVAENIASGIGKASPEEIEAAADAANATEFIREMPEGFETVIGERGVRLSGGQRQRLAIAREILRDPGILILDEATSALDSESEALIQDALEHLLEGRTSIVIAHRLSTVMGSDLILVMEGGRIVERGRHEELLEAGGRYSVLYRTQFKEHII